MQKTTSIRQLVQASESFDYKKVTLTNLFKQQILSKQFKPTLLKQQFSRPQTMQIMRSRNSRIQSSTTNFRTEAKTRPFTQSQQRKIQRYISSGDINVSQSEKLKVRKVYGRMNILADGVQMEAKKQISAIFDFLQTLSETNNHHQKVFGYINNRLRKLVYVDSQTAGLKKLAQISKNNLLIKIVLNKIADATYQDLSKQLIQETQKVLSERFQFQKNNVETVQQLHEQLTEKADLIEKLKAELTYYKEHPSLDLFPKITALQKQIVEYRKQNLRLQEEKGYVESQMQMYKQTNELLAQKIEGLKSQVFQMEVEKLSSMNEADKNSQLVDFENNVDNLKQMLHKSVLRMQGVKQQYEKVKDYNQNLISERSKLAKRAAVGFQQLTPRPKYQKIFQQHNLNFSKLKDPQPSTEQIVNLLVKTCKQLFGDRQIQLFMDHKNKKSEKQQFKDSKKRKQKNMPQKVIEQIKKADQFVKKTMASADQVKKAYMNQKNKRDQLQASQQS